MPFTVVGLLSGGKDSCYNLVECARRGHTIGVLANLQPYGYDARTDNSEEEELDSQCFQTVGSDLVPAIADCMQLPLLRRYTKGKAITTSLDYYYDGSIADRDDDEVEDLYALLEEVCRKYPQVNAVSSGAILSNYQRNRVENVCQRLGLTSLCFLWQRDQQSLLQDMVDDGMKAIMVKIASMGLKVSFLGKTLAQLQGQLLQLKDQFGLNVCGEGGEYETLTLDAPIFRKRIQIQRSQERYASTMDPFAPVAHLKIEEFTVVDKAGSDLDSNSDLLSHVLPLTEGDVDDTENPNQNLHQSPVHTVTDTDSKTSGSVNYMTLLTQLGPFICSNFPEDPRKEMTCVFADLKDQLKAKEFSLQDVCFVNLYLRSLEDFNLINEVYFQQFSGVKAPSRACVEVSQLPSRARVALVCTCTKAHRTVLHVKSISQWAPVSIGPYAQANQANEVVFVAGMIGLVPDSMQLANATVEAEVHQAARNLRRVLQVQNASLSTSLYCNIYVSQRRLDNLTHSVNEIVELTTRKLQDFSGTPIFCGDDNPEVDLHWNAAACTIVVQRLPRDALIELECVSLSSGEQISYIHQQVREGKWESNLHFTHGSNVASIIITFSSRDRAIFESTSKEYFGVLLDRLLVDASAPSTDWTRLGLNRVYIFDELFETMDAFAQSVNKEFNHRLLGANEEAQLIPANFACEHDSNTVIKIHCLLEKGKNN